MFWANDYVGIPFKEKGRDREGCDCWGLVKLVLKERLDIDLPDYGDCYNTIKDIRGIAGAVEVEVPKWVEVKRPEPIDVVLLRARGLPIHVGIMIDRIRMLHVMEGINSSVENLTSVVWKDRVIGYYRYAPG